jgi:Zn-dependent M16 (insulinase) family peptidase
LASSVLKNIAACKSSQTSADAKIKDTWHGIFTYYFCKEIRDCQNQRTRAEILKKIPADLRAGRSLRNRNWNVAAH